jgi:hypothetical protein
VAGDVYKYPSALSGLEEHGQGNSDIMNNGLNWNWKKIELLQTIRKTPFVIVFNILLFLIVGSIFYFSITDKESENHSSEFLLINQADIKPYDPYILDKYYLPIPDKSRFLLNLSELKHDKYFEIIVNPNNRYDIEFRNDDQLVGELSIKAEETLNRVPETAVEAGYNKIVVIPVSGNNFAIGYFQTINNFEDNVIFQEYGVQRYGRVRGSRNEGSPYDITGIIAYLDGHDDNSLDIRIKNIGALSLKLISISTKDKQQELSFSDNGFVNHLDAADPDYHFFHFDNVPDSMMDDWRNLYIYYQYENDAEIKETFISPFPRSNKQVFDNTVIRDKGNITEFDFIEILDKEIYFSESPLMVDSPIIIPKGYRLFIEKGQTIDLVSGAFILSYSPIEFAGTEKDPILIKSSDNNGQGIAVIQANDDSIIQYAIFDHLSSPRSGIWELSGAIVFYESDVNIDHSVIRNNSSEDALNIIRSAFSIENTMFSNTFGDALDSDYSQGRIMGAQFTDTGNDGLDISASSIDISDTSFYQIGDKAISVEEKSDVFVENVNIENTIIGVESKDLSQINGEHVLITNAQIGYALYQTKPEFGPASINITHSEMKGYIGLDYLLQRDSSLVLNEQKMFERSRKKETLLFDKLIIGETIK